MDSFALYKVLSELKEVQDEINEKALSEVLEPRVRAAYAEVAKKLSVPLSNLDYILF